MIKNVYFSICIPVYNREETIGRTLKSIYSQKYDSYEVLIVNDGSNDNTELVIKNFIKNSKSKKFYYFYKKNGGKHSALNVGIEQSKGVFFIILDSDDMLYDNDSLGKLHEICKRIENDNKYCGVMGKSKNLITNKNIDVPFKNTNRFSYIDFRYLLPLKGIMYNDCFEANKTSIIKKYTYPEKQGIHFVPESYIFDQIGLSYDLLCTNSVFQYKEYLDNGITKNANFKRENAAGFLYYYILRLEKIIPNIKCNAVTKFKLLIISWYQYWMCVKYDRDNNGPRINKITILAMIVYLFLPMLNYLYKTNKN